MGVKLAVIGGGSTYTPELVEGLAAREERLPVDELALLDPDAERLEVVGGLSLVLSFHRPRAGCGVLTFACVTLGAVAAYSSCLVARLFA